VDGARGEPTQVLIRPMRREDLDGVMEIETAAYRAPWSREVFLEEMHRAWAHLDVLRESAGGPLLGFVNYWIVGDEVHVLNVATHPGHRRRGLARSLLRHVDRVARAEGCRYVTLEVRRSNHGAIRLYRRHGYRPVGLRPRYYEDGEDAILMALDL
jgi:ribosomal-protein-alanine N-acetyltransferase